MKTTKQQLLIAALALAGIICFAQTAKAEIDVQSPDTLYVPERAIILHGDASKAERDVLAVFYTREDVSPNDPDAPRFLFLDSKGKVALGIGGQVYATGSYDMRGAINSNGFSTYDISIPSDPTLRSRLGANLSNSSLFLKLVGKASKFGIFQAYIKGNFTGNSGGYGFTLKQAYLSLGHLTLGLTNSTFVDVVTEAPVVDTEGPSGKIGGKNILFRYVTPVRKGFSAAVSVELPKKTYTLSTQTEALSARVPDVPAYVQYSWQPGQHIRLSGIFRDMPYRDVKAGVNRLQPGYGVTFSAITNIDMYGISQFFGHIAYGRGIAQYVNDLSGEGFDLVYSKQSGEMEAPETMAWTAGVIVNATPKLQFTTAFSRAQVYELGYLGGSTYRYGEYFDVNAFYNFDNNLKVGAEYLHGWRTNYDGQTGTANRVNLLVSYSF